MQYFIKKGRKMTFFIKNQKFHYFLRKLRKTQPDSGILLYKKLNFMAIFKKRVFSQYFLLKIREKDDNL